MGAPRTLGVLLCLLAQLSPHPLGRCPDTWVPSLIWGRGGGGTGTWMLGSSLLYGWGGGRIGGPGCLGPLFAVGGWVSRMPGSLVPIADPLCLPGVSARSLPVPATVPTTVPVPISVPNTVPATVPATTPVIVPGTVPNIVPDNVPTTAPPTILVPTVAEEEEDDEEETKEETEGRVMAALKHLASVLQNPPPGRRDPPGPETLLDLIPELRDLLVTSLSPPIAQPPNLPP